MIYHIIVHESIYIYNCSRKYSIGVTRASLCIRSFTLQCIIMGAMASQIISLTIVYSTVYWGADQGKDQSFTSLAFVRGIYQWPVEFPTQMAINAENVSIWWRHGSTKIKRTPKVLITDFCEANPLMATEFPSPMAINKGSVFVWWNHHCYWSFKWYISISFLLLNFCTILLILFHFFSEWGSLHSHRTSSDTPCCPPWKWKFATQETSKFPRDCHVCEYYYTLWIPKICHFQSPIEFNISIRLLDSLWPSDVTWCHQMETISVLLALC